MFSPRHSGVVLLSILLIVVLVIAMVSIMTVWMQGLVQGSQTLVQVEQMNGIAQSVQQWVIDDIIQTRMQGLPLPASKNLPDQSESGFGITQITWMDMQARFNLNDLSSSRQAERQAWVRRLTCLIKQVAPEEKQAFHIAWMTAWWVSAKNKEAETYASAYAQMNPPYAMAYQSMQTVHEWRLVAGVTESLFNKLSPYLAALPARQGIHINTVSLPVLACLYPDGAWGEKQAKALISERDAGKFYKTIGDLPAYFPPSMGNILAFDSQYFLLKAAVQSPTWSQFIYALIQLKKDTDHQLKVQTMWESAFN